MKAPAFQLYASDFMADPLVDAMEPEELGGYFRLLLVAWQQDDPGYLPNDPAKLASWSRLRKRWTKHADAILACFKTAPDGRLYQKRMVAVAAEQAVYREKQRLKGVASAEARKRNRESTEAQPETNRGSTAVQPDTQPEGNPPSPPPSPPKSKKNVQRAAGPTRFDALYTSYPRHEGRQDGMDALEKAILTDEDFQRFSRAVATYAAKIAKEKPEKKHVLMWSTFANGRWLDYADDGALFAAKPAKAPAQLLAEESRRQRAAEFEGQP